jgi:hypothetical protein
MLTCKSPRRAAARGPLRATNSCPDKDARVKEARRGVAAGEGALRAAGGGSRRRRCRGKSPPSDRAGRSSAHLPGGTTLRSRARVRRGLRGTRRSLRTSPRFSAEGHCDLLLERGVQGKEPGAGGVQRSLQLRGYSVTHDVEEADISAGAAYEVVHGGNGRGGGVGQQQGGYIDDGQRACCLSCHGMVLAASQWPAPFFCR